jgi:hypothetical protein
MRPALAQDPRGGAETFKLIVVVSRHGKPIHQVWHCSIPRVTYVRDFVFI